VFCHSAGLQSHPARLKWFCLTVPPFIQISANGSFDVGFSDALRERLGDADRCLASEKRSSGKLRGWAWWVVCCYGDLVGGFASDMT
jgi:hypothetical protein